jgi:hypothetical protein
MFTRIIIFFVVLYGFLFLVELLESFIRVVRVISVARVIRVIAHRLALYLDNLIMLVV